MEVIEPVSGPLPAVVAAARVEVDEPRPLHLDAELEDLRGPLGEDGARGGLELLRALVGRVFVVHVRAERLELLDGAARPLLDLGEEAPGLLERERASLALGHRAGMVAKSGSL